MRLPIVPFLIAAMILAVAVYFFNSGGGDRRVLAAPRISQIADITGVETEVAVTPDGSHLGVSGDGDVWIYNLSDGHSDRITQTSERESFPAWSPDGKRLTFTQGPDTFVVTSDRSAGDPPALFKSDATSMSWSPTGRVAYV